jgi:hypothetical protein
LSILFEWKETNALRRKNFSTPYPQPAQNMTEKPKIPQDQTNTETAPKPQTDRQKQPYKLGRPTKYKVGYCQSLIDYFTLDKLYTYTLKSKITSKTGNIIENFEKLATPPVFFSDFAYKIGTTSKTLLEWTKHFPAFSVAYTRAKELQHQHIVKLANIGLYNSNFAQFTMVNISEWRIKNNIEHSGKVESQLFFDNMLEKGAEAVANEKQVIPNASPSRLN